MLNMLEFNRESKAANGDLTLASGRYSQILKGLTWFGIMTFPITLNKNNIQDFQCHKIFSQTETKLQIFFRQEAKSDSHSLGSHSRRDKMTYPAIRKTAPNVNRNKGRG